MVQLDFDEEVGPLHGMYGSMDAEELEMGYREEKGNASTQKLAILTCG